MILTARRRHRRAWLVLALVLPAVIAAAWWVRPSAPVNPRLPAALREPGGR